MARAKQTYIYRDLLAITLLASLIYFPFLGDCALFDWDEVNFAECARDMLVSGNYSQVQLNYQMFWEKPPLFIWMQALSMHMFGINEFAARFPNAVCSIVTLCSIYLIGNRHASRRFALTWVALYLCSLLPHFYFRTGIIDPWFNLFIFLSLYNFFVSTRVTSYTAAFFAGLTLGAAVLTKGPAALLIAALTILSYLFLNKNLKHILSKSFILFTISTLFFSGLWFLVEWLKGNGHIITAFIDYQIRLLQTKDAGHGGPFFYHFVVLLIGCFPASLLFILFYRNKNNVSDEHVLFRRLMLALFWTVLILFSIVETKIVHYSSLCYFPLTYVASLALLHLGRFKITPLIKILYWIVAGVLALAAVLVGSIKWLLPWALEKNLVADAFTAANLSANVQWSGIELLLPAFFIVAAVAIYKGLVKGNSKTVFVGLAANVAFITVVILRIIPGAELYVQEAPIAFYKACAKHDCNIETHAFKSYAHLFYSQRKPSDYADAEQQKFISKQLDLMVSEGHSRLTSYSTANQLWMEHGIINKPSYIVAKCTNENAFKSLPYFHKLYSRNGYSFFVRLPDKTAK